MTLWMAFLIGAGAFLGGIGFLLGIAYLGDQMGGNRRW
jgi:hypothetical protein